MLRTELPHASRVVSPASASMRIAVSTSWSFTKWNWMFCRVVMWPKPRENRSPTSASASSCGAVEHALRNLDAQHLHVAGLPLAVGAADEAEHPPLVGRQLAALEFLERGDKLVDVGLARERKARPPERLGVVYCCHV